MRVVAYTDTARDCYTYLPTLTEWVAALEYPAQHRRVISEWRMRKAAAALEVLPSGGHPEDDSTIRVGYYPVTDGPIFIRKVDKGYIHVAYPEDAGK